MKIPHTTFTRGKHVFCITKDKEKFDDYWMDKTDHFIVFRYRGKFPIKMIKSLSIWRNQ